MEPQKLTPKLSLFGGTQNPSTEGVRKSVAPHDHGSSRSGSLLPVAVRDLAPLLVDAFQTDRTWLKDFGREEIHVSADLYEILLAYQQYRRYDAA